MGVGLPGRVHLSNLILSSVIITKGGNIQGDPTFCHATNSQEPLSAWARASIPKIQVGRDDYTVGFGFPMTPTLPDG